MRAYYVAALVLSLTGCREIVRELLKDDHPSESTDPAATKPPTATPSSPEPRPDDPPPKPTAAPTAKATATAPAKKAPLPPTGGNCTNVCEKSLKCMNAYSAEEQQACVTSCEGGKPDPVRLSHLYAMDCTTLVANLKGGGGGAGANANKQASPCGADKCSTCVWDGSSCYSRVPPFLACDSCCCRPGGPAPRWD